MRISFVKLALLTVLACATAVPAAAQDSPTRVGAAVTFMRELDQTGAGFLVDASRRVSQTVAVVGELGVNSFDGFTLTAVQGGARLLPMLQTSLRPFVQALVGVERCCEQNALSFQVGGGVEIPANDRFDIRLQYDYRRASYDGEAFTGNRFGVGVALPLGN